MTTRFADHLLEGDHASRPTATTVPTGTLYACSDHNLIYQSDGATWSTWASQGSGFVPDPSGEADDRILVTASGALVYADQAAGGGGAGAPNFAIGAYTTPDSNTGFNDTGVDGSYWNGGWRASTTAAQNDKVGWNLLLNAGTYNFEFVHLKASGSGIGNVYLGGVLIGTFDAYAGGATANNRSTISGVTTSAGAQLLEIRMATKNASASAYGLLLHGFMVRQTA